MPRLRYRSCGDVNFENLGLPEAADEIDRLQAAVASGEVVVTGSVGQPRVHPALTDFANTGSPSAGSIDG